MTSQAPVRSFPPTAAQAAQQVPVIQLEEVSKTYRPEGAIVQALRGVDLIIRPNEFVAVMGRSGSGKSTLLHILGLLDNEYEGTYRLDGELVSGLTDDELARLRNRKIGFVFQSFLLLPQLTILENAELPALDAGRDPYESRVAARARLEQMGLGERLAHKPMELSIGQRQRAAIARALVNEPRVLLADEPTGALDTRTAQEILDILHDLRRDGATVVLVTHDHEVGESAERIIHITDGQTHDGMAGQLVRFAVDGLQGQRGRSLLTMLGMAIGSASVVAVVSIGLLGREYVVSLIEGVGSNLVFAYGVGGAVNPEELTFEDVDAFRERVTGIDAMAPVLDGNELLSIRGVPQAVTVLGVTPEYYRVRNLVMLSGRFFNEAEESTSTKVCVISRELALKIFGTIDFGEESLRLFGLRFRILGVFREGVESAAALQKSEAAGLVAIIPFSTFRNVSDVRFVDVVYFRAVSPEAVPAVVEQVTEVIKSRHRSLSSFKIESLDQYLVLVQRISDAVSLGLIAIAAVSLLVGGIGIMNIMLVTVTERTQDIGIRLALGASRRDILLQFLLEASILSFAGGIAGTLIGAGLPVYVGIIYGVDVPVSGVSVGVAFAVSVGVGLFFGLYPAQKAANMNIIDALGYT